MALAVSGASTESWGSGGVLAPELLDAPPDPGATSPACFAATTVGRGLGREDTHLCLFPPLGPFENIKKCLRFLVAEMKRLEAF